MKRSVAAWAIALCAGATAMPSLARAEASADAGAKAAPQTTPNELGRPPAGCHPRASVAAHEVSPDAVERLRALPGTVRLSRAGEYRLRDGRVLVVSGEGDTGLVFAAADWTRYQAILVEERRLRGVGEGEAFHPLKGLVDDGARFGAEADALSNAFVERLGREGLSKSSDGADHLFARFRGSSCRLDRPLARASLAYVGRLVLEKLASDKNVAAKWAARDEDGFAAPVIEWRNTLTKQTRTLSPWQIVARLVEEPAPSKLAALVDEAVSAAPVDVPPAPAVIVTPGAASAPGAPASTPAPADAAAPASSH